MTDGGEFHRTPEIKVSPNQIVWLGLVGNPYRNPLPAFIWTILSTVERSHTKNFSMYTTSTLTCLVGKLEKLRRKNASPSPNLLANDHCALIEISPLFYRFPIKHYASDIIHQEKISKQRMKR